MKSTDSVIPGDKPYQCFVCGSCNAIHEHHIFEGSSRSASERWGLKVHLCLNHHTGYEGVHTARGKKLRDSLHKIGQTEFIDQRIAEGMTEDEAMKLFIKDFIRSYL